MRILRTLLWLLVVTTCLTGFPHFTRATIQSTKPYQQMTLPERGTFVSEQTRRLARQMSGRDYQFTPAFEAEYRRPSSSMPGASAIMAVINWAKATPA